LRNLFSQYGTVQTCIVNHEKRHAFIKMITRQDAIAAKDGMDAHKPADMQLRVRFLVDFRRFRGEGWVLRKFHTNCDLDAVGRWLWSARL
jgi:hypothetical protein